MNSTMFDNKGGLTFRQEFVIILLLSCVVSLKVTKVLIKLITNILCIFWRFYQSFLPVKL